MYNNLSKEEKKEVRTNYAKTKKGESLSATLNRLVIEGLFLIVCFVVIVAAIFIYDLAWWYWCFAIMTIICAPIFLIAQYRIRISEYNKFIAANNKYKTKAKQKNKIK